MKQWNRPLLWIDDALTWSEQELLAGRTPSEISEAASRMASDTETVGHEPNTDLTPFRIDPPYLEPQGVTYRPLIEVDHVPTTFKTVELSFGETRRSDEHYPSPSQLARELDIDSPKVGIERLCGAYGSYEIFSIAASEQRDAAAERARQMWDGSTVTDMFKAGKVERARFGFEEIETGFRTWLSSLENPASPRPKAESRTEYLADLAQRETLIHALDVKGFREHAHVSSAALSDQELLVLLHKWRASSKYIPESARQESQIWLAQHNEKLA